MYKVYVRTTFSDGMYDELDGVKYDNNIEAVEALEEALDDPLTGPDILGWYIQEFKCNWRYRE